MAVALAPAASGLLTYSKYQTEGEIMARYDIIDGVRHFMANPTRDHQELSFNVMEALVKYARSRKRGKAYYAPCDILISRNPLKTRQPDVLFMSYEQLAKCPPANTPTALEAPPEIVVEVLSPTETRRIRTGKIDDYCRIGVLECWVVDPSNETIEVLRLYPAHAETIATYGRGQILRSDTYPDLEIDIDGIFAL